MAYIALYDSGGSLQGLLQIERLLSLIANPTPTSGRCVPIADIVGIVLCC